MTSTLATVTSQWFASSWFRFMTIVQYQHQTGNMSQQLGFTVTLFSLTHVFVTLFQVSSTASENTQNWVELWKNKWEKLKLNKGKCCCCYVMQAESMSLKILRKPTCPSECSITFNYKIYCRVFKPVSWSVHCGTSCLLDNHSFTGRSCTSSFSLLSVCGSCSSLRGRSSWLPLSKCPWARH